MKLIDNPNLHDSRINDPHGFIEIFQDYVKNNKPEPFLPATLYYLDKPLMVIETVEDLNLASIAVLECCKKNIAPIAEAKEKSGEDSLDLSSGFILHKITDTSV